LKKLVGKSDIENALLVLDKLTQEEARMAAVEVLEAVHGVDDRVTVVHDKVTVVSDKVTTVDSRVMAVDDKVMGVSSKVKIMHDAVKRYDDKMRDVGNQVIHGKDKISTSFPCRPKYWMWLGVETIRQIANDLGVLPVNRS
jgi:hypothetical protein